MVQQILSTNTFTTAKWVVSATSSDGTHTTIASALTSASSGDTIFIRPGTYTENLTLKAGVNLTAYSCDALTPNVTISGKCTFTAAGTVSISGINLQTNSDFALAVTGSAASIVNLNTCYLNCSNNTGISFTSSSSSASISFANSSGNLGTTGIGLFTSTSAGSLSFFNCALNNTGGSSTASTTSTGVVQFQGCSVKSPLTTSSTGNFAIINTNINCSAVNATSLTTAGTGATQIEYSDFISGTASAISIGTGTTVTAAGHCRIESSNTNAITGAGTIKFGLLTYSGSSSTNNVSTQTQLVNQPVISSSSGAWTLLQTQTASSSANITFTSTYITSTYNKYVLVMNNVVPATNGVSMSMTVSVDNGSNYLATGYKAVINVFSEAATANAVSSTTLIPLTIISGNTLSNTTGVGLMGTLYMLNWTSGSSFPEIHGNCSYLESSAANTLTGLWGGRAPTTNVINNIKIVMSSGNIATGTFSLYGISS